VTPTAKAKAGASSNGNSTATTSSETLKDDLVARLREDRGELLREWVLAMAADDGLWTGATTPEQELDSEAIYDACVDCLDTGSYRAAEEYAERMAQRAVLGVMHYERILSGVLTLRDVYWHSMSRHYLKDPDRLAGALKAFEPVANKILLIVAMAFNSERERVVRQQQEAIQELSTPVLQVRDRLLILPIIGLIDSDRALQLTEQLLGAIREFRARVVVMDVTGVAAVDSKVANHLIQTVDAARLLGTTVIVTGISASIAQTIVTIGIDLSRIQTVGDLQGGLELADRILGYQTIMAEPVASQIVPTTAV
jgi:rsbT co-antagonist protein RsbR